jgi:prepilin signal peptidase PulO-like enzyme (type II secretory pathway)
MREPFYCRIRLRGVLLSAALSQRPCWMGKPPGPVRARRWRAPAASLSFWPCFAAATPGSGEAKASALGDVKLAAAIGAWLPIEAIPLCFGLATSGALLMVMFAHFNGQPVTRTTRIPFGTFLCPALWIVFYVSSVTR